MTALRYNPLNYTNKLMDAGFNRIQAEALAQTQEEFINNVDVNLFATKIDINLLETALKSDINSLGKRISELEISMIKWMVGLSLGQLGFVTALIFSLIKFLK